MTAILGIDAAWTETEPSGVALVVGDDNKWRCLCTAPSYDAFMECARGTPIDWTFGRFRGARPVVGDLLFAAQSIAGIQMDVVAVDMPMSKVGITSRRAADEAISKTFGGQGCSVHSPNQFRPGMLGQDFLRQLEDAGYSLATVGEEAGTRRTIEVYPHPALLSLLGRSYRVPYKVGRSGRYWPEAGRQERITRLLAEFVSINGALCRVCGETYVPIPAAAGTLALSALKRYEDALDALVCAWVGMRYARGTAIAYGDSTAAIWLPNPQVGAHPRMLRQTAADAARPPVMRDRSASRDTSGS